MLKKRSKAISMLICLAFLFTMMGPGMAFGAAVDFSYTTATGIQGDNDKVQDLGFVRINDIDDQANKIYVEVALPADVDWPKGETINEGPIANFITAENLGDGTATVALISGDEDEYVVSFTLGNTDKIDFDKFYIRCKFNNIIVDTKAANDIVATVTVRGAEVVGAKESSLWRVSEDCLIGQKGDGEISVKAGAPKTVKVGSSQKLAKVTFTENAKGAFELGDEITITLPSDVKWDTAKTKVNDVIKGKYELEAKVTKIDKDELILEITKESTPFEDKLEFTGYVRIFPGIADGDVEVDIEYDGDADFDDVTLVLAVIGDSDLTFEVDDTSDDAIYPASYGKKLDRFIIDGSSDFSTGDQITLTLSEGLRWYETSFKDVDSKVNVIGFYDGNESVWLEVTADGVDKLKFKDIKVAALPEAPLGDITITVGEDYNGEFVVGAVEAQVEITADRPVVETGKVMVEAGDITLVETGKKIFDNAASLAEKAPKKDITLILSLPNGVEWADNPTVKVNDKKVDAKFDTDSKGRELTIGFKAADFRASRIDSIEISNILYDLDSRLRQSEIKVEIGGTLVNYLKDAKDNIVEDLEDDYADKTIFEVVNAVAVEEGQGSSVFIIGSSTYTLNGVEDTMGIAPYISGDRTYLPIRYVAYAMGVAEANVLWDQANQTVTLIKGDKVVQLKVGSTTMLVNGVSVTMDAAPQNVDPGYVCLPIRFVAQAFGVNVDWDAATQQVTLEM